MPVPMAHKGSPPEWEASWVNFVKKDFQWNACAKGTWRQSTSLRSLMSVNFAKKINEMSVPMAHKGSPPQWESSWVNFVKKDFQWNACAKSTWRQSTSLRSLMSVNFAKKKSVKCQCQWNIKAVHLDEKPLEWIFSKKDFQWNASANGTWRQSTSLRSLMTVNFAKKNQWNASAYGILGQSISLRSHMSVNFAKKCNSSANGT